MILGLIYTDLPKVYGIALTSSTRQLENLMVLVNDSELKSLQTTADTLRNHLDGIIKFIALIASLQALKLSIKESKARKLRARV